LHIDLKGSPPDAFWQDQVDSLADKVVLRFDDITKSTFVDAMLSVLSDNPALFGEEDGK